MGYGVVAGLPFNTTLFPVTKRVTACVGPLLPALPALDGTPPRGPAMLPFTFVLRDLPSFGLGVDLGAPFL